jgi:hypothetical protein
MWREKIKVQSIKPGELKRIEFWVSVSRERSVGVSVG